MIPVSLQWITEQVNGELRGNSNEVLFPTSTIAQREIHGNVRIDSRNISPGDVFIAIQGANFDGHNFVDEVVAAGAVAVICSRPLTSEVVQIIVADTHKALGALAAAVKAKVAPKSCAITGSSGKTTVKEMVAAILRQAPSVQGKVLATAGNYNNDIGVPLTLLELTYEHTYGVFELGANHRGEIAYTTQLVRPDVALINNIAPAHVEGFGDICGVAKAKTEIFRGLSEEGIAITNADSDFHEYWLRELAGKRHYTFGVNGALADVRAENIVLNSEGCARFDLLLEGETTSIQLAVPGKHNVKNALAAISLCRALGVPIHEICQGFAAMPTVPGRMNIHTPQPGVRIIDDTYNANVGSAKAAIDVLASLPGQRLFVLGDMGELGTQARAYHEEVGAHGVSAGIDGLFSMGVLSQSASEIFNGHGGQHFESADALVAALAARIAAHNPITILIKGSRSAKMERIVAALLAALQEQPQGIRSC